MIEKLNAIYREYNQDMAGVYEITVKIRLLLKQRRLEEALRCFHEGITFVDKKAPKNPALSDACIQGPCPSFVRGD